MYGRGGVSPPVQKGCYFFANESYKIYVTGGVTPPLRCARQIMPLNYDLSVDIIVLMCYSTYILIEVRLVKSRFCVSF